MYGTQAITMLTILLSMFENDVNMYGTQAITTADMGWLMFENDVNIQYRQIFHDNGI